MTKIPKLAKVSMQTLTKDDEQVCAEVLGRDVTRGKLREAFGRVQDPTNWKKAIDARIPLCSDFDLLVVREAVIFFTGSVPSIDFVLVRGGRNIYRVRAAGYYQTIGA